MTIDAFEIDSPLGRLLLYARGGRLLALGFDNERSAMERRLARRCGSTPLRRAPAPAGLSRRFRDYFAGNLGALDPIAVETGGTPFQRRVWAGLRRIPAGETRSYGELAAAIGAPGSARAVGGANARNPVAIVVPCHRVIAADGSLCGFASGVGRKRWLLDHERRRRARSSRPAVSAARL